PIPHPSCGRLPPRALCRWLTRARASEASSQYLCSLTMLGWSTSTSCSNMVWIFSWEGGCGHGLPIPEDVALVLALLLPLPFPAPPRRRLWGRHGSAGPGRRPPWDPRPHAAAAAPRLPWPCAQTPRRERSRRPPPRAPTLLLELGDAARG
ncbi:unnamed protein product, partial [Gulo gulo]